MKKLIVFLGNDYDQRDHEDLFPAIEELGVNVLRIHPYEITTCFSSDGVRFLFNGEELSPDLVVGWVYEDLLIPGMYLLEAFENVGVPVINNARTLFMAQNKYLLSSMLHKAKVNHLPVISGRDKHTLLNKQIKISYPVVYKPIVGFGGNDVKRFHCENELKDFFEQTNPKEYYLQPFVKNPGRDIRVLCINYHAVVAINRYAPEGGWITNTVAGGRPELAQLNNELIKIAEDASRACNTLISGVDVIEDISSGGYKILEVNSCPSAQPNFDLIGEQPVFLFELARFLVYLLENFEDGLRNWKPSRLI